MYFTREEIKDELGRNWEQLSQMPDPSDLIAELADGFVPVYSAQIIKDWAEMPHEFDDQWKDYGYDTQRNEGGIVKLMQVDLYFYYLQMTEEIYREMKGAQK